MDFHNQEPHMICMLLHYIVTRTGSDSDSDGGSERGEDWLEETDNADLKGATKDFHQIFLDSGFTCNPEKHAFNYFKAFLGNVQFFEVSACCF